MVTEFEKKIYDLLKKVPGGKVTTYAELAKAAGRPKAARAVGNALNRNPYAPQVPCHRVVKSDGRIGGYAGGSRQKISLLKKEGVEVGEEKILNFRTILYRF